MGQGKAGSLLKEQGPAALAMMRAVKAAIDPLDLMSPGKVLPLGRGRKGHGWACCAWDDR